MFLCVIYFLGPDECIHPSNLSHDDKISKGIFLNCEVFYSNSDKLYQIISKHSMAKRHIDLFFSKRLHVLSFIITASNYGSQSNTMVILNFIT